jgi:molybdopterin converting factor small subunit
VKLAVQLFARARELAGREHIDLELAEPVSVADVRSALADQLPQLVPLARGLLIAVGTDYADDTVTLDAGDTIACFPPVSGG